MRFHLLRGVVSAAILVAATGFAAADEKFKIDLEPVFQGNYSSQGVYPIAVGIQNLGPDARGVLHISSDGAVVDYPVELPRGSNKRVITYPVQRYSALHFSLQTDQGNADADYDGRSVRVEGTPVLLVSDSSGELAFLTSSAGSTMPPTGSVDPSATLVDCYVKPALAPTRPAGYGGISSIILGAGAERLSDGAIQAVKLWVLTGGTLVFVGGVSAPVLGDARWGDLIPAHGFQPAELPAESYRGPNAGYDAKSGSVQELARLGETDSPAANVTSGSPSRGATSWHDGSVLVWAEMPRGLGKTVFLSFNPFEAPLEKWSGRKAALTRILRQNTALAATSYLQQFANPTIETLPSGVPGPATATPGLSSIEDDPFSMTLPPTERIFVILAAYFVVVVPINFLVLKKLRRGELAWFTAPVISLAFAGILFASAGSLYKAKMSTVSNGLLLAQQGDAEGEFIGVTQMFIPHAGSYNLGLKNVEMLGTIQSNNFGYMSPGPASDEENQDLEPVDVGEIQVPSLVANNLAFRRLTYRQRVPMASWFSIKLEPDGQSTYRCEVENASPYTLKGAAIAKGASITQLSDLAPGQRRAIDVKFQPESAPPGYGNNDIRMFTLNQPRVVLIGTIEGFRPGPQLGTEISDRSVISLALFSPCVGERK